MNLEVLEGLLRADDTAMIALEAVRNVGPRDAYIAAGFVRNRCWDSLYPNMPSYAEADIDVVYFDPEYHLKSRDLAFEASLKTACPGRNWQVRNQARMHCFGGHLPFKGLEHALQHWAETATGVGVRLSGNGEFEWVTAFGFADLFNHVLRISPSMKATNPKGFEERLVSKAWCSRWPRLKVVRK